MSVVKVSVKWGKELYTDIQVNLDESPLMFKTQLFALTGVPPDRQKVMIKGGLLKDDEWGKQIPKEGASVMLMGSVEAAVVEAPKDLPKFVEDLPESQQAHLSTKAYGSGLVNLGNTCYMNSVVQCIYAVKPVREALSQYQPVAMDPSAKLVVAAKELLQDMQEGGEPFQPLTFLMALRTKFPQFAQMADGAHFAQQDAEECWTNLLYTLREKVKDADSVSVVERLFGVKTLLKLKCEESSEEQQEEATNYALKCNIDGTVNYLTEGIQLALKDDREKHSAALGRTALFKGSSTITRLPPYLTVQLVRFFYKVEAQAKAKVLRKVQFQLELDTYEMCSPELKATLDGPRAALFDILEQEIQLAKTAKKPKPGPGGSGAAGGSDTVAAQAPVAGSEAIPAPPQSSAMETDGGPGAAGAVAVPVGHYTGAHTGKYELFGVLTHQGRSADSGHYTAWVKQSKNHWVQFDDDKLVYKTDEDILSLSGGGDWHMAYLLMYRAVTVPPPPAAAPTA